MCKFLNEVSVFYSIILILVAINEVGKLATVSGSHFGYSRPEQRRWARQHHQCGGKFQSPIAIYSSKAVPITMPAIEMIGYHNLLPGPLKIHNNGHSVSMSIPKNATINEKLPYIFGGKLQSTYEIEGLHFHWGDKNSRGSEHVINDIRYPIEMHIIHRNTRYKDLPEALGFSDGLCVLAFFYQLAEYESPELTNIVRNLSYINEFDTSILLNSTFTLATLIGDINMDRFYMYRGSLTTPPCSEAVTWVIFPDTLPVTNSQMVKFRQLSNGIEGAALVDNFRSLQPIGNRRVFLRKINGKNSKITKPVSEDLDFDKWDWLF